MVSQNSIPIHLTFANYPERKLPKAERLALVCLIDRRVFGGGMAQLCYSLSGGI